MYIHLSGRHYDVNHFQPQAFVSGLSLPSLSIFWDVSRRSAGAILTSPGGLYRLELRLDRLFLVYQQGFFLSAGLFRKIWVFFLAKVSGNAVSSEFKFLDARNLTCLQPLPNALYTKYYSLKHRSFRSVWTQKQNNCVAFWEPLLSL